MSTENTAAEVKNDTGPIADLVVEIASDPSIDVPVEAKIDDKEVATAAPKVVEVQTEQPEKIVEPPVKAGDDIADFKRQLDELSRVAREANAARDTERRMREDAERIAVEKIIESETKDLAIVESRYQTVKSSLAAEKAEADAIAHNMRIALANQDNDQFIKAQRALTRTETRIAQLEEGLSHLADEHKRLSSRPKPTAQVQRQQDRQQPQQPQTAQPVTHETVIAQFSPRTQDFLRKRDSSWVMDEKTNNKLRSAHFAAVSDGHVQDSDSYFEAIDKMMAPAKADPTPATTPARKSVPAAPVSRKAASQPEATSGARVTLSPREQQAAKDLGITITEYARRKHIMTRPGWGGPKFGQNT